MLLLSCAGAGIAAALLGQHYTGSSAWLLAVPACIAAGWFAVADPTACVPARSGRGDDKPAGGRS